MKFCGREAVAQHKINVFVLQKKNNKFTEKILLQLKYSQIWLVHANWFKVNN